MLGIQIVAMLHGQRVRNVFHYLYPPDGIDLPDGKTAADNAIDDFIVNVLNPLLPLTSTEYHVDRVTAQWVLPTRYRATFDDTGWDGTAQGNCLPSYCAVVVQKYAELAGPEFQGRNYFAGIPSSMEDNSRIEAVSYDDWTTFAVQLLLPLNLGLPASDVFLITKTPESINPIDIASIVVDSSVNPVLRAQRRREVGVGE